MKKTLGFILAILLSIQLFAVIEETASFKAFLFGTAPECQYDSWVTHISEGIASNNYNLYAPYDRQLTGFGAFSTPSADQLSVWETAISSFINGELDTAQAILTANNLPFTVVIFNDTDTGRQYYMIRENLNLTFVDNNNTPDDPNDDEIGSFDKGWGLYVMWPQAPNPIIVNLCHPNDDFMTPPIGHKAFVDWQAKYFMITGAGREVLWTNSAPYTNSKSLSDPSRVAAHPYSKAYNHFADNIRQQFSKREFAPQIHSYDWNRHVGYPSLQLSVGNTKTNPNLPTRDLSSMKLDFLNSLGYVIFPQNSIGVHEQVDLDDYISVWYDTYPFTCIHEDSVVHVSNYIDLPGFAQNVQQNKSWENWTDWDRFDPFFHIEMDELPNSYPQNTINYWWFYGYDPQTGTFDKEHRYDRVLQYYGKWVNAMSSVLPAVINNNDNIAPTIPQNFAVVSQAYNYIRLGWTPVDSYDFYSYEILYATQPINETNFTVFNRTNTTDSQELASLLCDEINVTGLQPNQTYYFKIRAKDYNNNVSALSPEISGSTGPANIDLVYAFGQENKITLKWRAVTQNGNQGFKIERKTDNSDFVQIADWNTSPNLAGSTQTNLFYTFYDTNANNNITYTYRISAVSASNFVTPHFYQPKAELEPVYTLYLKNQAGTIADSVKFTKNAFASDGKDTNFDVTISNSVTGNYVFCAFYEQYWSTNGDYLDYQVHGDFDPTQIYKLFTLKAKSNQLNQNLIFSISDNFGRSTEKLYIKDITANTFTNLQAGDCTFQVANTNERTFQLIWGNFRPTVTIPTAVNKIYRTGNVLNFSWTASFTFLNGSIDVYLKNDTDSLLVASNLPANAANCQFTVPDNHIMQYAKLYVRLNALDGESVIGISPYTIGILPSTLEYSVESGLNLISNPFSQNALQVSQFGANALGYSFVDPNYTPVNQLTNNNGYALVTQSVFNLNLTYAINADETQKFLAYGWNLVGNPHFCPYNVKDLKFVLGPNIYTYGELLQQEIIGPSVYVYRDGKYQTTKVINPYESFFLYGRPNTGIGLQILFTPYNTAGYDIEKKNIQWETIILAQQNNIDADEIIIGASSAKTQPVMIDFESPEPPVKPNTPSVSFFVPVDPMENNYSFERLNSYYFTPFATQEPEFKEIPFKLTYNELTPIVFTADRNKFPDNYSLRIVIEGQEHVLYSNNSFSYIPMETGELTGTIKIGNEFVGNQDNLVKPFTMKAYPNPFNPETNIQFNLPKAGKVEIAIYNIKGQKVKTLLNDQMKAGEHKVVWNGKDSNQRNCASNVYFVRMKVNGSTQSVKKLTLIK